LTSPHDAVTSSPEIAPKPIPTSIETPPNAAVETVDVKPMFRDAYKKRRCVVPVSGFYEWTGPKTNRQPHLFTAADGSPLIALAGLWDSWKDPATGEDILSCTLITINASTWMKPYHDRSRRHWLKPTSIAGCAVT
jgi:putative SOS response-associated peptidase YedK